MMNALRVLSILLSLFTAWACGRSSSSDDSKASPTVDGSKVLPAASSDPSDPAVSASKTGAPSSSGGTISGSKPHMCLSDCNPPQDIIVSFAVPVSIAPAACTVGDALAYASGGGIMVITLATCSNGTQVYSQIVDTTGKAIGSLNLVSGLCNLARDSVTRFTAAAGANSFAVSYTCSHSTGSYQVGLSFLGANGKVNSTQLLLTNYTYVGSVPSSHLAWNSAGNAYGMTLGSAFKRFSEQGAQLGGDISVPMSGTPAVLLSASGGVWNILSGAPAFLSTYPGSNYCSKISSAGTLECSNLALGYYLAGASLDPTGSYMTKMSSGGSIGLGLFDANSCTVTTKMTQDSLSDATVQANFGAFPYGPRYLANLYQSGLSAIDVAFVDATSGKVLSTSGVVNGTTVGHASGLVVGQKFYVVVAKDNDLVLVAANQSVPQ